MNQNNDPEHISKRRVVYSLPGMESVAVRRDMPFDGIDGPLAADVYSPSQASPKRPVVVLVNGYPDPGFTRMVGCRFKELGSTVSWAQLIAASGLVAVAATNQQPEGDLRALVNHLAANAASIGIDPDRMGVWASSGHGTLALSMLLKTESRRPRCVALLSPYLIDVGESRAIEKASAMFHFANPGAGRSLDDLAADIPMFVARAGQDQMPGLNSALDAFVAAALTANLPLTVVNHPAGPHAFDLFDNSESSRIIVRATLAFLCEHLS